MRVLIACEFSQVVCKAFRERGHEAYSCDLLPTEGNPEWHFQCDVSGLLEGYWDAPNWLLGDGLHHEWDLMIAHPPCTYLANSGVRWYKERNQTELTKQAASFFNALLNAPIKRVCVENPIQHKYAREYIREYDQIIQPHYFMGSNESKATCLWLKGLPELKRTQWLDKTEIKQSVFRMPPGETRSRERSRFPVSIVNAMAEQWGMLALEP